MQFVAEYGRDDVSVRLDGWEQVDDLLADGLCGAGIRNRVTEEQLPQLIEVFPLAVIQSKSKNGLKSDGGLLVGPGVTFGQRLKSLEVFPDGKREDWFIGAEAQKGKRDAISAVQVDTS